jgi:hypothetical protein
MTMFLPSRRSSGISATLCTKSKPPPQPHGNTVRTESSARR